MYAPLDPTDRVHWVEEIKERRGDGSVGAGDLRGTKKGEVVMMRTCSIYRVVCKEAAGQDVRSMSERDVSTADVRILYLGIWYKR